MASSRVSYFAASVQPERWTEPNDDHPGVSATFRSEGDGLACPSRAPVRDKLSGVTVAVAAASEVGDADTLLAGGLTNNAPPKLHVGVACRCRSKQ